MQRQHDLAAVRVARQHERDVERRGFGQPPRIVREQDRRRRRVADEWRDVHLSLGPEAHADEVDASRF